MSRWSGVGMGMRMGGGMISYAFSVAVVILAISSLSFRSGSGSGIITTVSASSLLPICTHINQTDCVSGSGIRIGALHFNDSQTSNFSIILVTGFIMLLLLCWFHWYYSRDADWAHSLRAPFPDSTMTQLEERSCRKFIRLVMIHHPISMLIYAYVTVYVRL